MYHKGCYLITRPSLSNVLILSNAKRMVSGNHGHVLFDFMSSGCHFVIFRKSTTYFHLVRTLVSKEKNVQIIELIERNQIGGAPCRYFNIHYFLMNPCDRTNPFEIYCASTMYNHPVTTRYIRSSIYFSDNRAAF